MMREALGALAWLPAGVALASSAYLTLLTALAAAARLHRGRRGDGQADARPAPPTRFAVLVPAHNEEALIGRLLTSLRELDYPPDRYDVYVIADNCEDATAAVASAQGTRVLSRRDSDRRGKGYAVAWALERIPMDRYEAVAMVDADSVVEPGFLRAMDRRLAQGAGVVQGYYGVLAPASGARALRAASFALMHLVRPLGKSLFGGSCGLKGNGMAFSTAVLAEVGWRSFSIVEDAEQHVRILQGGTTVQFEPEAVVWGEMPDSLRGADSQNLRWEAGRWKMARRHCLPLLWRSITGRSLAPADSAVELLVPPLSVIGVLGILGLVAAAALGSGTLAAASGAALAGLALHIVGGLLIAGAPAAVWRSLAAAPVYLIWKCALYARALAGAGGARWVRTPRAPSPRKPS